MNPIDLARFAIDALRGHRLRSMLSVGGVAIGVASVILLTSLGEGARRYVAGEFSALGSNLLIVLPGKTETTGTMPLMGGVPNDLTIEDAEALVRYVRQVRRAAPMSFGEAPARYGSRARDVSVVGTTADFQLVRSVRLQLGQYLPSGSAHEAERVCVIGARLRRELFRDANPLGEILRLGDERFRVVGVMAPRGTSIGLNFDEMVYVPVRSGLRMFNRSGLFRIFVEVANHDAIPATKQAVIDLIRERHDGEEDVTVITQDALLSTFGSILGALTAALGGIAGISLSVAGIGIMNVMLVSVSERTPEVGLLKALGAGRGQILFAFLTEAAVLSTLGGGLGLGIGLLLGRTARVLYPSFPIEAPLWAVMASVTLSIAVGIVFGLLPARRAADLDPVQALTGR